MMRKLVLFCLALALAAASVPAMAATNIDFNGYLNVYHENLHNFSRSGVNDARDNDSFFENKLHINVEFQPTDDISVFWGFRGPNYSRWGSAEGSGLFTRSLYAEIRQPWGTLQIGRLLEGLGSTAGGVASLGYSPAWGSDFLYAHPFDIGDPTDSIVYSYDFGNGFVIAAFYAKDSIDRFTGNTENVDEWVLANYPPNGLPITPERIQRKDADRDRFGIEPRYQWDTGGVSLGVVYVRDKTFDLMEYDEANNQWDPEDFVSVKDAWEIHINPAFVQSWGPFSIHFEGVVAFGKYKMQHWFPNPNTGIYEESQFKNNGLGLYLDGSYNYGAGDITLMGWYADGTSENDIYDGDGVEIIRPSYHSAVGMGDFAPFLVAYNKVTLGTGTWSNRLADGFTNTEGLDAGNTNHWGIAILGNHAINDDIKLNYGLGYFRLVSVPSNHRPGRYYNAYLNEDVITGTPNRSKSLGFEIDLGATFQILDNLSFETQFGYMFNGNAYRQSRYDANDDPVYDPKPKDTFAWANVLSVTF
jgi:hypothetical protein